MNQVAQNSSCYSKSRQFLPSQPKRATSGDGCTLYTDQGQMIDFVCGLGSNLIDIENNFSLESRLIDQTASRIIKKIPFIEQVKFLKTGSEACTAAVKIARTQITGRSVFSLGYHGWHDTFEHELCFKYKIIEDMLYDLSQSYGNTVFIEPVMLDLNVKEKLQELREVCTDNDHMLIFDEVVTGFRFPGFTAAQYFGVIPDLIVLGKGMANGYPLACVGGPKKYMEGDYFVSSTFASEDMSLKKCCSTLDYLTDTNVQDLWTRGQWFQEMFNLICTDLQIVGYPTRGEIQGKYKWIFQQEMSKHGYLFGTCWFITHKHTDKILKQTLDSANIVLNNIMQGRVELESEPPVAALKRN